MTKQMSPKLLKAYPEQDSTYERFRPEARLHIVCPQCRAIVLLCEDLDADVKRKIAELQRNNPVSAMNMLKLEYDCDLRQAKAIIAHTRVGDAHPRCRNCDSRVRPGSLLCPQCMSVTLDW